MVRRVAHQRPSLAKALAIEIQQLGSTFERSHLARISQSFGKRWREPDDLVIAARDVLAVGIPIVMRPPGPDAGRAVMRWKYEDVPTLANVKFNTLGRHAVPIGIVPAGQGWVRDIGCSGSRAPDRRPHPIRTHHNPGPLFDQLAIGILQTGTDDL